MTPTPCPHAQGHPDVAMFLHERRRQWNAKIRTHHIQYEGFYYAPVLSEHPGPRVTTNRENNYVQRLLCAYAPLWGEGDFVPGHVQTTRTFWSETVLNGDPRRERLLSWIGGVQLDKFIDTKGIGVFHKHPYKGQDRTGTELPTHVDPMFDSWVITKISKL